MTHSIITPEARERCRITSPSDQLKALRESEPLLAKLMEWEEVHRVNSRAGKTRLWSPNYQQLSKIIQTR